jgi:hypothetical protein
MRIEEFRETPLGGYAGEMAAHVPTTPAPPPPESLRIERPDWEAEAKERGPDEGRGPQLRPVEAMLAAEQDERPPPVLYPPVVNPPLERPTFPAPDFRAEEAERDRERVERDRVERERQALDSYPAGKAARRAARATPNKDRAREIQREIAEQLGRAS